MIPTTSFVQIEVRNTIDPPGLPAVGKYFYDGKGQRIKKVTPAETTVFVYDAGGALVAEYSTAALPSTPTTNYLTTDHLGSPRVVTDSAGAVIARRDFMPFGEELGAGVGGRTEALKYSIIGTDKVRQRFTGYEKDDETQLDFAEARMYQNKHGRFTAVDPLMSSANKLNPQTFNRYTYTGNNPVNYTDPSGLDYYRDDSTKSLYWFAGSDERQGYTNITGQTIYIGSDGCFANGGCVKAGQLVYFSSNSFITITDPTPAQGAQIAPETGTTIVNTVNNIVEFVSSDLTVSFGDTTFDIPIGVGSGWEGIGTDPGGALEPTNGGAPEGGSPPDAGGDADAIGGDFDLVTAAKILLLVGNAWWQTRDSGGEPEEEPLRVGRWMGSTEYQNMINTGRVQEGTNGITNVVYPANPDGFGRQATSGSLYVEFDLPNDVIEKGILRPKGGGDGWYYMYGPNSPLGRLNARKGLPLPELPPAKNIKHLLTKP